MHSFLCIEQENDKFTISEKFFSNQKLLCVRHVLGDDNIFHPHWRYASKFKSMLFTLKVFFSLFHNKLGDQSTFRIYNYGYLDLVKYNVKTSISDNKD